MTGQILTLIIMGFGPLLKSLWMTIDLGLYVRQAIVYREHAFEENGTYQQWAINNTKLSSNFTQTVSQAYFQTSCITFLLPPLMLTFLMFSEKGIPSFIELLRLPLIYIGVCLICYMFTPLFALVTGLKVALTGNINLVSGKV